MPLLLLDLDNTLVDRTGAFRQWARAFLPEIGAPDSDLEWLMDADDDGFANKMVLAEKIRDRYLLDASLEDILAEIRIGVIEHLRLDPLVACALEIAAKADWLPVIVTNGTQRQQEAKIRRCGLDRYVAGWIISEEAGLRKPDPRIFAEAARRAGRRLGGSWMVGDNPAADIGGATSAGIPSVWISRGRRWSEPRFAPTCTADNCLSAVYEVLAS
ncbi:HAD family hydrolase [Longispora albida]|uniref:HAD family hydrolase n=1 Tax=Longispora albida TaxID=203523 RepID=UPI000476483D|nr:HAD family hydrolase [Longispora albida]